MYDKYTADHVEKGIKILKVSREMQAQKVKGAYHRNLPNNQAPDKEDLAPPLS